MVRHSKQRKRSSSPIPDDPVQPSSSGYVRAKDGTCVPLPASVSRPRERALSPSVLPGVRAIPSATGNAFRAQLVPGVYYAKSMTQYLGPFQNEPTEDELPSGDSYFIFQHMGKVVDTGKDICRYVRHIVKPAREAAPPRPISPSQLPGVRAVGNELSDEVKSNLTPGKYYAKSMTIKYGPFDTIPTPQMLPRGESYVILQVMGHLPRGDKIYRKVTQIDC